MKRIFAAFGACVLALSVVSTVSARAEIPTGQPLPIIVATTVRCLDVSRIQENIGEYSATIEMTFRWQDERSAFDPVKEGRYRQEYLGRSAAQALEKIWNPGIIIRNMVGAARSDEMGLIVESSGKVTLVRQVEATFRMPIDMSRFPFDRQPLPVELLSNTYGERYVVLAESSADRTQNGSTQNPRAGNWSLTSPDFHLGTATAWNGETRSLLTVTIDADRRWPRLLVRIFAPFFTIMLAPLFVLWAPDTNYFPKGTMIFSAMVALIALNFTLENSFPGSLSSQTPISVILTSGYIYLALALILNVVLMNPEATWARNHFYLALEIRSLVRWALPGLMTLFWLGIILGGIA